MKRRLAIITSHPIQYNAPLFALLAQEPNIELMVFYTWGESCLGEKYDPDFGKVIEWDIPLLDEYIYTFVKNSSLEPGSHHFKGIINPSLNQEIEEWKPDVIWVWGWAFDSHLKVMRHFKGKVPVWFRGDSTLLDEPNVLSFKKIARRIFLTWVYRHVEKAFYVGTHNKAYFKKYGLKESQLIYAPHAVDNNRFADESGDKTLRALEWRKELGYSESDFVILFAGKFEQKKNPSFILELSKQISSLNVKFLMVGNGILEAELKSNARDDSRFVFLDLQNQSQMPILYRVADLFILPSLGPGETWGLAINEALASGTKVIASKFCGGAIDLMSKDSGHIFSPLNEAENVKTYIYSEANRKKINGLSNGSLINGHSFIQIIDTVKKVICK
jgi:glycosyltransferase involved in cell wall biosynthesis